MKYDGEEYCPICSDRFKNQEEMLSHFESHSVEEKMKVLKSDNAPSRQEYAGTINLLKKPSSAWYLVPFLFAILGGIIAYVAIKNDDQNMAINMILLGVMMTFVSGAIYFFILVPTFGLL